MTSPQFLEWLESKFEDLDAKKVVPPASFLVSSLYESTKRVVKEQVAAEILKKNGFNGIVDEKMGKFCSPEDLNEMITESLRNNPGQQWNLPVQELANKIAKNFGGSRDRLSHKQGRRPAIIFHHGAWHAG